MGIAPSDQSAKPVFEPDAGAKIDLPRCLSGRTDAIAHECRIAAWGEIDRLVRAGEADQQMRQFAQRGSPAGADVVKAVGDLRAHRAEICLGAILDRDKVECLAAVT